MTAKNIQPIALPYEPFYTDENYCGLRRIKILYLSDALRQIPEYENLPYLEKINLVAVIENSCLNEAIRKSREYDVCCTWENTQFVNIYHSICYNILTAIDPRLETSSLNLIKKIFTNEINLETIAGLPCRELCVEKYEELQRRINARANIEENQKCTKLYFCTKCKNNSTTAQRVQNRSGDEGSSFRITCLFCHNQWFGN